MSKKKDPARRTVRVSENPVTHRLESTVLDAVQLAFERIVQTVDGQMLKLATTADRERLARRLLARVGEMLPRTDGPVKSEAQK